MLGRLATLLVTNIEHLVWHLARLIWHLVCLVCLVCHLVSADTGLSEGSQLL